MIKKLKTALKVHLIFLTIVSINISVVLAAEKGKWGTECRRGFGCPQNEGRS